MLKIVNFCNFKCELFLHMQWKADFKENPYYMLNGAVYMTLVKGDEHYLVTVQPVVHTVEFVFGNFPVGEYVEK